MATRFIRLVRPVRFIRLFLIALATCAGLLAVALPAPDAAERTESGAVSGAGRFFLMGDGRIHIKSARNGVEADVNLLNPDGSFNDEAFTRIDEVFGFPTAEKGEHISPRLLFMLDYFSDQVAPGKMINMESGYRSPEYNNKLRDGGANAAKTSVHIDGMALDFNIEGVNGKDLWELVRSKNCCGAGHYGGANIHLDAARPRFWEAASSGVGTGESEFNRRMYLSTDFDSYSVSAGTAAGSGAGSVSRVATVSKIGAGSGAGIEGRSVTAAGMKPGSATGAHAATAPAAGRTESRVRLSLSSVSDFGFGVKPVASLVYDAEGHHVVKTVPVKTADGTAAGAETAAGGCIMIPDRKASRFIYVDLPPDLRPGRYRIKMEFCNRPFEQMPQSIVSNEMEVSAAAR